MGRIEQELVHRHASAAVPTPPPVPQHVPAPRRPTPRPDPRADASDPLPAHAPAAEARVSPPQAGDPRAALAATVAMPRSSESSAWIPAAKSRDREEEP
jgi:hypothetical protein